MKITSLFIVLLFTFLLVACNPSPTVPEVNRPNNGSMQNTTNNSAHSGSNNPTSPWLSGQDIYGMHAINYSNGLALVPSINGETKKLHAIDASGNLLFTLDNYETAYETNSFTNGLIYIYDLENKCINLMTDTGKIITPEDVGGTHFEFYTDQFWSEMFNDGYIIVKKVSSDFQGTTFEAGILDTSFNIIADYSTDLYSIIYDRGTKKMYINNYIRFDTYDNGQKIYNAFDIQANKHIKFNYDDPESDIFDNDLFESLGLMDYRKYGLITVDELGAILGLDQYPTLYKLYCVNNNLFLAIFSETMGMGECFYTLVDENGTFKFDPIKYGTYDYFDARNAKGSKIFATNSYVVTLNTIDKTYDEGAFSGLTGDLATVTYEITTYDTDGNVINTTHYVRYVDEWYPEDFYFDVNEEAIIVADHDQITYYDFNLNIMCEN